MGDLAIVDRLDDDSNAVFLKLIPRLETQKGVKSSDS